MGSGIVIADTSVIINFLRIDRMDLIGAHPSPFIVTDHVADEIADSYPEQQTRFRAALGAGHITQQRVDGPAEVEIFLRLSAKGRLGAGERSAIAVALNRGRALAIDDSRAIRRAVQEAGIAGNTLTILRTQDLMVQLIHAGIISVGAADIILHDWNKNHRFKLKIGSFSEVC
jgi:predicted nucleic acid-binding protein